jgi:hypothetical protein
VDLSPKFSENSEKWDTGFPLQLVFMGGIKQSGLIWQIEFILVLLNPEKMDKQQVIKAFN